MLRTNSKQVKNRIREAFASDAMGCAAEWAEWLQGSPEDLRKAKEQGRWETMEALAMLESVEGSERDTEAQKLAADFIKETVLKEKAYDGAHWSPSLFAEWCQGLPGALDTARWYCHSAIDYCKKLLEETDGEASRYSETQAEELITGLFFREIDKLAR